MPPVTVATCTYVSEAEVFRGRLAAEGIAARLGDAEVVTADWTMSVAVGGVKVLVAPADAERARAELAAPVDPFDDFEPSTPAEVASQRALTGALIATPFFLGTLFGVYNVGRVIATADGETARTWRRTAWAALILLPVLWILSALGAGF